MNRKRAAVNFRQMPRWVANVIHYIVPSAFRLPPPRPTASWLTVAPLSLADFLAANPRHPSRHSAAGSSHPPT